MIEEVAQVEDGSTLYIAHHDIEEDGLTVTLSLALAAAADSSPTEFLPRFQEYVDPDALDRMFRPQPNGDLRKGGPFQFSIEEFDVEIFNTGRIEIRE
ncbi:HalOD1 output domain-containing protein [Haloglomus halophilum]|uniref:HalOD1 output domain-containing protein n=1 Tax=Haloglomus halophilum TaxID=2962672 RepID=UPI0020C95685|nr:HalOD1 output domain-containing protein [Haloglomus halophilum]